MIRLLLVLCIAAALTQASLLDVEFPREAFLISRTALSVHSRNFAHRFEDRLNFPGEVTAVSRRLKQAESGACAWDDAEESCFLSAGTVIDFLKAANNNVANYLRRALTCRLATRVHQCVELGCEWHISTCNLPHQEFREFVSVSCLEEAEHFLEEEAGELECIPLLTQEDCDASPSCYWYGEYAGYHFCLFDRLLFNHGIPTVDGLPEHASEILDLRLDQLNVAIREAIRNETLTEASDLLEWELPPFECPRLFNDLVCDYAEALIPRGVTGLYCRLAYPRFSDFNSCIRDPLCELTNDAATPCTVSTSVTFETQKAAEDVLARAVQDPETRRYELQSNECLYALSADDCPENCTWIDSISVCTVSLKWRAEELSRVVGDSKNRVCKLFTTDVTTECTEREDEETCNEDITCVWRDTYNACTSGLLAWMEVALENTELHDRFRSVEESCLNSNSKNGCENVDFDIDDLVAEAPTVAGSEPSVSQDDDFVVDEIEKDVLETTIDARKPIRGDSLGSILY